MTAYTGREHDNCQPAPTTAQNVVAAQRTIDGLVALAQADLDVDWCYPIRDALLPNLSPGERERAWFLVLAAERARRHLTAGDLGWHADFFVARRRDEDDDAHLTRALDEAEHRVRFAATTAVVADTIHAQRVDADA